MSAVTAGLLCALVTSCSGGGTEALEHARRARAELSPTQTAEDVSRVVSAEAGRTFLSGDVPSCVRGPAATSEACRVMFAEFGQGGSYAIKISFDDSGRVAEISDVFYVE